MTASSYFCFHIRQLFIQSLSFAFSSFTATCCMFTIQNSPQLHCLRTKTKRYHIIHPPIIHLLKNDKRHLKFKTHVTQYRMSPPSVKEGGYHEGVFMSLFRTDSPLNSTHTKTCHIPAHPSCT